jgi:hypothetical protein
MKIDAYTKLVLTVIAGCLIWICVNYSTPGAAAQADPNQPMRVVIVDETGRSLASSNGLRVISGSESWPVVVNKIVPVALTAIDRHGSWQSIPVDIMKTPPTPMPTP